MLLLLHTEPHTATVTMETRANQAKNTTGDFMLEDTFSKKKGRCERNSKGLRGKSRIERGNSWK